MYFRCCLCRTGIKTQRVGHLLVFPLFRVRQTRWCVFLDLCPKSLSFPVLYSLLLFPQQISPWHLLRVLHTLLRTQFGIHMQSLCCDLWGNRHVYELSEGTVVQPVLVSRRQCGDSPSKSHLEETWWEKGWVENIKYYLSYKYVSFPGTVTTSHHSSSYKSKSSSTVTSTSGHSSGSSSGAVAYRQQRPGAHFQQQQPLNLSQVSKPGKRQNVSPWITVAFCHFLLKLRATEGGGWTCYRLMKTASSFSPGSRNSHF